MKLRRLDLIAYGPFTGRSLDLSGGSEGLHLIFGPNEAGKSSALRAVHDLFYGIKEQTKEDFVHDYNRLRVGAEIGDRGGNLLEFVRRKRRKNPITAPDDETPIEVETLERFLGGVDSETFRALFGIDHARLVEGGRAILEGKGQVGQLLFAAGSGLTGFRNATSGIQGELDHLFKPRGKNQEINRILAELGGLRKQIQEQQLPGEEWTRHSDALRDANRRKEELDRSRRDSNRERNRLQRIRDALKPIAERNDIKAHLDELGDVVPLPDDFAARHRDVRESLSRARALAEQAEADRIEAHRAIEQIELPEALLARAEDVEALHQRLGEYVKGQRDRPGVRSMLRSDEHFARDLLVELGKPRDLEAAESLRLRGDVPEAIRELGREKASLDATLDRHRQALDALDDRLLSLAEDLEGLKPPEVDSLQRVVDRVRKLGDPEADLEAARRDRDEAGRSVLRDLARLPHWTGSIEDLARLVVPLDETIEAASRALAEAEQHVREHEHDLVSAREELGDVEAEIHAHRLKGDVPTEPELLESRRRRDEGWRFVRLDWQGQPSPDAVAFIAEFAPEGSLAEAFERSLALADEQADRLRREAERAAALAGFLARRDRLARRIADLERARRDEVDRLGEVRREWFDRLRSQDLPALEPDELRSWLRLRAALVQANEEMSRLDRDLDARSRTILEHRQALDAALRDSVGIAPSAAESLADRAGRASAALAEIERRAARGEELARSIDRDRRERDAADHQARETARRLERWQAAWAPLMERIGLEAGASPSQADAFLGRIAKMFTHVDSARGFRARVEGIDRDALRFSEDVAATCRDVAPDLVDRPPEDAVAELYLRLGRARDLRKGRDALVARRDEADRKARAAAETIAGDRARLVELCREARCDDPDTLAEAEAASAERARLESDLRRIDAQIRDGCAGAPLEAFIAEALEVDADGLELRIREFDEQLDAIEEERSALDQTIGGEGEWLRSQHGGDEAADAAERTQSLLAELRSKVEDYAALRIAVELLHRGIEQFREENQGPVIRRAGELFAALTAGSFQGLKLDEDQGQPVLHGVRDDGRVIGVEAMSDGSCDQLYLALRLASLEGWLARHEPIPLIADDILLNFDDERSAAALRALADLSSKTQVLFFTHHEHLVDLARALLPADVLFVHRLDRANSGITAGSA